jgi:hypothetical protein
LRTGPGSVKSPSGQPFRRREPDFRALLRLKVRTSVDTVKRCGSRCSHDLSPLRGSPAWPLGNALPSCTYLQRFSRLKRHGFSRFQRYFRVSIRPGLGMTTRALPTAMRFATSSSLRPLRPTVANRDRTFRTLPRKRGPTQRIPDVTPCENSSATRWRAIS